MSWENAEPEGGESGLVTARPVVRDGESGTAGLWITDLGDNQKMAQAS